jgi:hypothetical protein
MSPTNRPSFRQIRENTKTLAAESAWDRAEQASSLRHLMLSQRRYAAAARLGEMKEAALKLAVKLLPEQVTVTIDDDYHVGLISVRWKGHGRCHLPLDADITPPGREARGCACQFSNDRLTVG